ncbi:MAG: biotin synthase BioB [Agathobacter sp.]
MEIKKLASEIIEGRRLTRTDDLSFFKDADLQELASGAEVIREALCSNHVDLCTIINGRAGRCSENCKFCAQSAHNHTGCDVHGMLEPEVVLKDCKEREAAGVTMYHENIETSKRNFPNICTTHTYEDKIDEIKMAKEAGLTICSGGIIGMGETWEDRVDMAISLAELEVESIPINALIPVKGTPFEDLPRLTEDEIIRTLAMFRFINPTAYIRMAAGRNYFADGGKRLFRSGVNATITGDMLTTVGNNTKQDIEMLTNMGFDISRNCI